MASFSVVMWPKNHVTIEQLQQGTIRKSTSYVSPSLLFFNVFKKDSEPSYHTDGYLSIINSQFEGLNDRTKLGQQNIRVQRIIFT